MKIMVSACLLGHKCKYNGKDNYNEKVIEYVKGHEVIPVCPEVEGGLPVPRLKCEILNGIVTNINGESKDAEFRKLIEYYQYIEMHLKGICADYLQNEDKDWFENLQEYQSDPFGTLIKKIEGIQKSIKDPALTQTDMHELNDLRIERNYWVHECFGGNSPIIFSRDGEIKRKENALRLKKALNDAITWDEKLAETARKIRGAKPPMIKL